jgi:hypothetical protein
MPVNIQLSKISIASAISSEQYPVRNSLLIGDSSVSLAGFLRLVGPDGIEPSTSPLSGVRSSHLSYGPRCFESCILLSACVSNTGASNTGGAGRDRTGDLLNANQALSQLSYSPLWPEVSRLGIPRPKNLIEASWIQGPET